MYIITTLMLVCGGLFAGSTLTIAWNRIPAWKRMPIPEFKEDFGRTIDVADRTQPLLLILTIIATVLYGLSRSGPEATIAFAAAAGFCVILVVSLATLVPLQRRMRAETEPSLINAMRPVWMVRHTGRTALSILSFVLLAVAASF